MRLEYYDKDILKNQLKEITGRYLDLSQFRLFFFGSRVSGTGDDRSDIDIGIDGPTPVSFEAMRKIREDIEELPMLYKLDVVDFKQTSSTFQKVAKENLEIINEPQPDQSL